MSSSYYAKALKAGQKEFRQARHRGLYPYLPALDELISRADIVSEVNLGLVHIPLDLIAGTKTAGRKSAFSCNFMPLLSPSSEFADKWSSLCQSHLDEGIHSPITAYEYMNHFYVQEGNKRVSVLKFFQADSIAGTVIRLIPRRTESRENKIYYEFLSFYELSKINYIYFTEEGRFAALQSALGKGPQEAWSDEDRINFSSLYYRFTKAFLARGGADLPITPGDALLTFLNIYDYQKACQMAEKEFPPLLTRLWDEILLLKSGQSVNLLTQPAQEAKPNLLNIILPSAPQHLNVAFVHGGNAAHSSWVYSHELGRAHLEQVFGSRITTRMAENVSPGPEADQILEDLIQEGCDTIFTTTPTLSRASLKAAVNHPKIRILNCSQNLSHYHIRTYYGRMYEAKFLLGAIAGSMSPSGTLGYVADYPIYGATASINAFALGSKMVNPRAVVYLEWNSQKSWKEIEASMRSRGVEYLSDRDMISPREPSRQFGLHSMDPRQLINLAMPVWHWGKFYEKIIQEIFSGTWKVYGETDQKEGERQALNYWWGMSEDVIEVICSQNLPIGTRRLVQLLRSSLCSGQFTPFAGPLYAQGGQLAVEADHILTPAEITTIDWLAENVAGSIPSLEELSPKGREISLLQGLEKE